MGIMEKKMETKEIMQGLHKNYLIEAEREKVMNDARRGGGGGGAKMRCCKVRRGAV